MDSEKVRPKNTPKSSPRPLFYGKTVKFTPKATPKGTLKSIKNHKKPDFGPRDVPGPPRTPKVCKKATKSNPNGTQNYEKVMPKTKKETHQKHNSNKSQWGRPPKAVWQPTAFPK